MFNEMTGSAVALMQLALTPVFLIVGVAQLVNVVTGRVGRIIDRARWVEELRYTDPARFSEKNVAEMKSLGRRMRFANWAITFLTAAALSICFVVVLLIANGLINYNFNHVILFMFILAMALITGGLIAFFLEVSLATATLKITPEQLKKEQ